MFCQQKNVITAKSIKRLQRTAIEVRGRAVLTSFSSRCGPLLLRSNLITAECRVGRPACSHNLNLNSDTQRGLQAAMEQSAD